MSNLQATLFANKLYRPPTRPQVVSRPRLTERLNEALQRKLTLVSAPAGFGKTTLVGDWAAGCGRPVAWLALDEADNDPTRLLTYLIAALQRIRPNLGEPLLTRLQSPQPPSAASVMPALLSEIADLPIDAILVLDDLHVLQAQPAQELLSLLLEHLPPQLHLVVTTREDPALPLARLRARGQLLELRTADLRFTRQEVAALLGGLQLSAEEIALLESRTEGWIAGLQLAAISMKQEPARFLQSFSGSHRFILDYLVEEVLAQQPAAVQVFLLRTSILDRFCGSLCDTVLGAPAGSSQESLAYIERANLFIVPLDDERRWYRYHHLFGEALRKRLQQSEEASLYHQRASQWCEANGLYLEAFQHAAAAQDLDSVERLLDGNGLPRHFRGTVTTILNWFDSLPPAVLRSRPSLSWRHASLLLVNGQTSGVAAKLQAAEEALEGAELTDQNRNLIGQIAVARATLALTRYQAPEMLEQSRRALEYLHPTSLAMRTNANWTMGFAHLLQGDRSAAGAAFTEAIALGQASGDTFTTILATIGLGNVHEAENQLHLAAQTYRGVLAVAGEQPLQIICEAHLGLARVLYEWNDLDAAEVHGRQSLELARQYEAVIDRFVSAEVFLARVKLARGEMTAAADLLAQAIQSARERNFVQRIPEVVAVQVLVLLRQGQVAAAAQLAQSPVSQARVHLAQGDGAAALAALAPWRAQVEAKGWADERLRLLVVEALALRSLGERERAVACIGEALAMAEEGGFIRLFIDEGPQLIDLLGEAAAEGVVGAGRVLARFGVGAHSEGGIHSERGAQSEGGTPSVGGGHSEAGELIESLSPRELEVLRLVAQGLSNRAIGQRLFLALDTVKGHNRRIFEKLQVERRTEAVARARALGLL